MASLSLPSRARSDDRLSSSRFISRASGHAFANAASIGAMECLRAWIRAMRRDVGIERYLMQAREPRTQRVRGTQNVYLNGTAYIKPPLLQRPLRPRSSLSGLALPTLRSEEHTSELQSHDDLV